MTDTSWLHTALDRYAAATEGLEWVEGDYYCPWCDTDTRTAEYAPDCGRDRLLSCIRTDLPLALELLRQAAEALEAAIAGVKFACEYYAPSASAEAQILAHINGYDGNPDAVAILDRIRKGGSE